MTASQFRSQREQLGYSMASAARKCGVAYRTWQDWETGKRRLPTYAKVFLAYLQS